jgi:hypothetical protein
MVTVAPLRFDYPVNLSVFIFTSTVPYLNDIFPKYTHPFVSLNDSINIDVYIYRQVPIPSIVTIINILAKQQTVADLEVPRKLGTISKI